MSDILSKVDRALIDRVARRGFVQEFRAFVNRGNVVDVSVAFVMGAAFKSVVDAFAGSGDRPGVLGGLIGAMFGGRQPDLSQKFVSVNGSRIELGALATSGVNFFLVAVALFVVVKLYNRLRDHDEEAAKEATTNELLTEIRDELRALRESRG